MVSYFVPKEYEFGRSAVGPGSLTKEFVPKEEMLVKPFLSSVLCASIDLFWLDAQMMAKRGCGSVHFHVGRHLEGENGMLD